MLLPFLIAFCLDCAVTAGHSAHVSASPEQTAQYGGVVVDSIVIDNRNIFDTDSEQYHHFVFELANKLHYKSRKKVIRREILFKVGDPFSPELAEETTRNLRQRLQLYDSWIQVETLPNGHLLVKIVTIDEWSLSGGPNVSRDGNETRYRFGLAERNLFGNNQFLSMEYFVQPSENNYAVAHFQDKRFFGNSYTLALEYVDNPLGQVRGISFGHPFYNLTQAYSFNVAIASTGGRRDIYNADRVIAQSRNDGDRAAFSGAYRIGSYWRKIQFRARYLYRYERTFDKTIAPEATDIADTLRARDGFPADSLYHQLGAGIHLSNLDFVKLKWIDGFGYTEDFVLGQALRMGLARAFQKDFVNYVFDVFDIGFSQAYHRGSSLVFFTYNRVFWFKGNRDIRGITTLSANYYYNSPFTFLTIAMRGAYLSDKRPDYTEAVTVSGSTDIRGFDRVFKTGSRKGVFNLEGRFYPNLKIFSVLFEGVLFTDLARSWQSDETLKFRDFYISAGMGLRIALEHSSRTKLIRVDFAYSQKNGWQLSIGTNQYFEAQAGSLLLTDR